MGARPSKDQSVISEEEEMQSFSSGRLEIIQKGVDCTDFPQNTLPHLVLTFRHAQTKKINLYSWKVVDFLGAQVGIVLDARQGTESQPRSTEESNDPQMTRIIGQKLQSVGTLCQSQSGDGLVATTEFNPDLMFDRAIKSSVSEV